MVAMKNFMEGNRHFSLQGDIFSIFQNEAIKYLC